jgi:hypothetical protein
MAKWQNLPGFNRAAHFHDLAEEPALFDGMPVLSVSHEYEMDGEWFLEFEVSRSSLIRMFLRDVTLAVLQRGSYPSSEDDEAG